MSDVDERFGRLPRDLFQDIKRAAYEAKVREMEEAARIKVRHEQREVPLDDKEPRAGS